MTSNSAPTVQRPSLHLPGAEPLSGVLEFARKKLGRTGQYRPAMEISMPYKATNKPYHSRKYEREDAMDWLPPEPDEGPMPFGIQEDAEEQRVVMPEG